MDHQIEHPGRVDGKRMPLGSYAAKLCPRCSPLWARGASYGRQGCILAPVWVDTKVIEGVPFDIGIVGYGGETVNFLRLWDSKSTQEFDLNIFNDGGYVEAVREKAMGETISKVLYPE